MATPTVMRRFVRPLPADYGEQETLEFTDAEKYAEAKMAAAFEALLAIELRYVLCDGRTLVGAEVGELITLHQALQLLEYHLNSPEEPRGSAWKVLLGKSYGVPGVKAVLKYLTYAGFRVADDDGKLERITEADGKSCFDKASQIAKRVVTEQIDLECERMRSSDPAILARLKDQNAAVERIEDKILEMRAGLTCACNYIAWDFTNLYEDMGQEDSTEEEWLRWWQEWCAGDRVSFWWQGGVACDECKTVKAESSFAEAFQRRGNEEPKARWRCLECQYPPCRKCQKRLESIWDQHWGVPYCSEDCKPDVTCSQCKTLKERSSFAESCKKKSTAEWRCLECQFPLCRKCQKPLGRKEPWQPQWGVPYCMACKESS